MSLRDLLGEDYTTYSKLLTVPTQGSSATIYLRYDNTNWNTIRIPTLPNIECIMTASADKDKILAGQTENVTIKIDTTQSSWVMADQTHDTFSERHYWAGIGSVVESQKVHDSNGVHYFTVNDVSPNTTITIWSSVTSDEIEGLGFDGTAEAVATIFIGELVPGVNDFMSIEAGGILKADDRGNERFDVTQGIPTGETLYANISANEYIGRVAFNQVTGDVGYSVTVEYEEITVDNVTGEEVAIPQSSTFNFKRSYSYWELSSFEIYGIDSATINNGALPGGKVVLTPTNGYHTPTVDYNKTGSHVSSGSTAITVTSLSSDPADLYAAAQSAVHTLTSAQQTIITARARID